MMESNSFLDTPALGASDSSSTDKDTSPQPEDIEESHISQNTLNSAESPVVSPAELLQSGRTHSRTRVSMPPERAGRPFNQSRAAPKPPTSNLSLLIYTAVATRQKKAGLSMQALNKIVTNMGYDMAKKKRFFLRSVKSMVAKGQLLQVKGTGATGSFKINPEISKKTQPKMRGKGRKTKDATKKKGRSNTSKDGRNSAKKQVKADVKRTCRRGKMSVQAAQNQVKV